MKKVILAIFLDVCAFLSLSFIFLTAYRILNYDPQTHIRIPAPIIFYDGIDHLLLFISQITLIGFINSKLLKNKNEIKIVHLAFLGLVIVALLISLIPIYIHMSQCNKISWDPVYRNADVEGQCATFMGNFGKGQAAIFFIVLPAILIFTFISLVLNLALIDFIKTKKQGVIKNIVIILLILAYPVYIFLRIPFFLYYTQNKEVFRDESTMLNGRKINIKRVGEGQYCGGKISSDNIFTRCNTGLSCQFDPELAKGAAGICVRN